jgi:hypothetical protein
LQNKNSLYLCIHVHEGLMLWETTQTDWTADVWNICCGNLGCQESVKIPHYICISSFFDEKFDAGVSKKGIKKAEKKFFHFFSFFVSWIVFLFIFASWIFTLYKWLNSWLCTTKVFFWGENFNPTPGFGWGRWSLRKELRRQDASMQTACVQLCFWI